MTLKAKVKDLHIERNCGQFLHTILEKKILVQMQEKI